MKELSLEELKKIELEFESMEFCAPKNYKEVLTKTYGEFMELSPKEKQITHHINKLYWKD